MTLIGDIIVVAGSFLAFVALAWLYVFRRR